VEALRELYALQNIKLRATAVKTAVTSKQQKAIDVQSATRNK